MLITIKKNKTPFTRMPLNTFFPESFTSINFINDNGNSSKGYLSKMFTQTAYMLPSLLHLIRLENSRNYGVTGTCIYFIFRTVSF